jgi:ketosteroid isomerase-like protein
MIVTADSPGREHGMWPIFPRLSRFGPYTGSMNILETKQRIREIADQLSAGNSRPYIDVLADDIVWTVIGTTRWSGTYRGKRDVVERLLRPVSRLFEPGYKMHIEAMVAEGDRLVVQFRGEVMTKTGVPYNNSYCWVCRMENERIQELTEYADTELFTRALR